MRVKSFWLSAVRVGPFSDFGRAFFCWASTHTYLHWLDVWIMPPYTTINLMLGELLFALQVALCIAYFSGDKSGPSALPHELYICPTLLVIHNHYCFCTKYDYDCWEIGKSIWWTRILPQMPTVLWNLIDFDYSISVRTHTSHWAAMHLR